jgi:hypothetical protein
MTYSTGHIPDHPIVVAKRPGLHLHPKFGAIMSTTPNLPMFTTNRTNLSAAKGGPDVINQDGVGGCEGCAHASAGTLRLANTGQSKGLISNSALYLGALMCDQTLLPNATLSTITDTGTMPSSIIQGWLTFGARLAANDPQCPMQTSTMYKDPSDPNSPLILPAPEVLYSDSPYRYSGAYFITANGTEYLLQALSVLASGRTITDAIPASDSEFQKYTGGILGALSGPTDHANHILDYEWSGSSADWTTFLTALAQGNSTQSNTLASNLVFVCVNSWSTSWGEGDTMSEISGGLYRGNIDYFNQAESLCVIDISSAS